MAPGKFLLRAFIFSLLLLPGAVLQAQELSMSFGLHTGIMSTLTMDNGISRDPRYRPYYGIKFAPIGANFSVNYEYFGFVISPSLINVGQNSYVLNNYDGDIGDREYNLKYLTIPVGFKVHIVNLAFLKISGIVSLSPSYLLDGSETVSHAADIMTFPKDVYPILPPDYNIEYDGVAVPEVDQYVISSKSDFRPMQVFAGAGLQSDWDVTNSWRVFFDLRFNYGLFDPRTKSYLDKVNSHQTLYDIPGTRHDMFGQFNIGIARYIDFEKKDVEKKKKIRSERKGYTPKKYPYRKPRNSKPGG
ncbi:outer membrane beta-barrel protein [Chryseolinea sp. T2]|uniref:outer membrane beta-barrel protein n=1 Tax=Chryseolinea sp. T2 TaxID=3129255 RepID=UPI00307791D5